MQNIMKKLVGFLIVSSIWLLPLILPEIQAQQTATPPSAAAPSPAITIEELKSRRMAIESMTDLETAVKTDSLKYIDRAIADAESAISTNKKANELLQLIQTAPERVKILQDELKKSFMPPEKSRGPLAANEHAKTRAATPPEKSRTRNSSKQAAGME